MTSNEFFTRDAQGRKTDAPLHDEILDNPRADLENRIDTALRAVADGTMAPVTAAEVYGIPDVLRFWLPVYEARFKDGVNMIGLGKAHLVQKIKNALETDTKIPEPPEGVKI